MGMVVQHNMNAINSYNKLNANVAGMKKSSEKLSSGYRINRAGDDAAGLAVSEKMRSQIKGLNQAIRNSQDGINMIQTFEGAAQETHSILQRMKELATQSANGTYDNATDRAAIQLEFDQLNDELNQIADTDYNGTVVLNGGEMADGVKAVNGEFNYGTSVRAAKQLGAADINKLDGQLFDNGVGDAATATKFWTDLGFDRTAADTNKLNDGPDSVDITFKYKAEDGTWEAVSATGGASIENVKVNTDPVNGGFQVGGATAAATPSSTSNVANVVLDSSTLVDGDTITLTFKNPSVTNTAPENIGVSNKTNVSFNKGSGTGALGFEDTDLKVAISNTAIESTNGTGTGAMTAQINELMNRLNGATISATYTATAENPTFAIALSNGDTMTAGTAYNIDGTDFIAVVTDNAIEIGVKAAGGNTVGTSLVTLTATKNGTTTNGSAGKIDYTLALDMSQYSDATKPSVVVSEPVGNVSKANSFNNSKAIMSYAENITLQTGARTKDSVNFTFNYNTDKTADMGDLKANLNLSSRADGLNTANLSLATQDDANKAIDQIDKAINKTSMVRASFGAIQNRLEHKITNLTTTSENLTEAESSIRDTDMASEMMNYTKFNILQQAAQSMLAQANQQPQSILQLLG